MFLVMVIAGTVFWLILEKYAHASSNLGIYAEQTMSVDKVVVRRVHDHGNGVICYVASGNGLPGVQEPNSVAISCVKEQQ
jgi:hypothetical protein